MYFLDFDRTLFDTDTFKEYLAERNADSSITGEPEEDVARTLNEAAQSGQLTFAPGELSRFLYADVAEFLRMLGNEAVIITYGNEALQKAKVESSLNDVVRVTALYTGDVLKAHYLENWPGYYGQEAVFTDDRVYELETMSTLFPKMKIHEMRRDGEAGDGRWPVVRSLTELP